MKKVTIELTPMQLDELINCVDAALYHGLAYGHIAGRDLALAESYRRRLLAKLYKSVSS